MYRIAGGKVCCHYRWNPYLCLVSLSTIILTTIYSDNIRSAAQLRPYKWLRSVDYDMNQATELNMRKKSVCLHQIHLPNGEQCKTYILMMMHVEIKLVTKTLRWWKCIGINELWYRDYVRIDVTYISLWCNVDRVECVHRQKLPSA